MLYLTLLLLCFYETSLFSDLTEDLTETFTPEITPTPDYRSNRLCICRDLSCQNCASYEQTLSAEQLSDFISHSRSRELEISLEDDAAKSAPVRLFSSRINANSYLREIKVKSRGDKRSLRLMFSALRKEKLRPKLNLENVDCHISFTDASLLEAEEQTAMLTNLDAKSSNITVEGIVIVDFLATDLYSIDSIAVMVVYQCELAAYGANKLTFGEGGVIVQSETLAGTILSGGYPEIDIELMNEEITLVPSPGASVIMNRIELELNGNTRLYAYGWGNILNANTLEISHGSYEVNVTTDDSAAVLQFGFDGRGDVYVNGVLTIHHSRLSGGAIAGIVIACVAFVILIVAVVLGVVASHKRRGSDNQNHNQVDQALDLATV